MSKEIKKGMEPPGLEQLEEMEILRRVLEAGRLAIEEVNAEYGLAPDADPIRAALGDPATSEEMLMTKGGHVSPVPMQVVVIHSLWDDRTRHRLESIRRDPRARRYDLRHIYPLRVDRDGDYIDEADFATRLEHAIDAHDPAALEAGQARRWSQAPVSSPLV